MRTKTNLGSLGRGKVMNGGSTKKSFVLFLVLLLVVIKSGVASEAQTGSIIGWGSQVVGGDLSGGFVKVAAGGFHSLGLKDDGSIVAWGHNYFGQCNIPSPNSGFIAIAAGAYHSLGLKKDGSIVSWGYDQPGLHNIPSPNTGFIAIAAGEIHSLGLKQDGSIVAWGYNDYGQCNIPSPNTSFIAIAGGGYHSLGLKQDGSIVAWGYNDYGQCNIPSPNSGFMAIRAGLWHSLGLKQDGSIVAWGLNDYGQCNIPSPNTSFIGIAGSGYHSLGLKQDGSIVAWGSNYDGYGNYTGQCNIPSPNSGFIAIAGGRYHSLAIANTAPVATAGQDVNTPILFEVNLDGSGSYDPDEDYPLVYSWQISSKPQGSTSELSNPDTVNPSFIPDVVGEYIIELVVSDSRGLESEPNYVVITAIPIEEEVENELEKIIDEIRNLDPDDFKNPNSANALTNMIEAALKMVEKGNYKGALNKLSNDILKKTDGCANTGQPDKNDWILTCEDQAKVYPLVVRAIELLQRLLE